LWADLDNLADQIVGLSSSMDRRELRGLLNEALALGETLRARERWIKHVKKALMPLAFLKA
jgi:phage I-like protein